MAATMGDPWSFEWVADLREQRDFRWIVYLAIDSRPLPPAAVGYLTRADAVAVSSAFGAQVMAEAFPDMPVDVILYGVDTDVFRPLPDRHELRAANDLDDRFVVGFVGRNQPRKQIPVLVKAFARFHEEHPDTFLYLHTDENETGWDVPGLLQRYGLGECSGLTAGVDVGHGLPDKRVNEIYNLFDVLVLPSNGEGFGLPLLEAMAAGVPVMTTDYSSGKDLVAGRGELIAVKAFLTGTMLNLELALPDEEDLADKLELLYGDAALRERHREAALEFSKQLTWDRCAESLSAIVDRLADRHEE